MSYEGGFSLDAQDRGTSAIEVLNAIVKKIRANVDQLSSKAACFVTATPHHPIEIEVQGNLFCTVCMPEGHFDQSQMDGGGNLQICELATVTVTVFSRMELDRIEHYNAGLTDSSRGLLAMKYKILKALAGKNLYGGPFAQGGSSSSNSPSSSLLMEPLFPRSAHIADKEYDGWGSMSLSFDVKFLWDTSEDSEFV